MSKYLILAFLLAGSVNSVYSQQTDSTNRHHLLNPTPRGQMREMQTDRPDVTESAYTVDAGHFQAESDAVKIIRNKTNGEKTTQTYFNLINLKAGITNSVDLQLVVESFVTNRLQTASLLEKNSGFGDLTIRLKKNIWGNDGGKSALALMPYMVIPTSGFSENKTIAGGLIAPFALELKNDWSFSAQAAIDFSRDDKQSAYQTEILSSVTFGKTLTPRLNTFIESYNTFNFSDEKFDIFLDGGLIYSLSDNFKLDAGVNYGLTKSSDKVYFLGFSFRY